MHFLGLYSRRHGKRDLCIGQAAMGLLHRHRWPGNVRELEHAIERAVILADSATSIEPHHLGLPTTDARSTPNGETSHQIVLPLGLTLDEAASRYARATITACDQNRSLAAKRLGVGRNTLARKIRE